MSAVGVARAAYRGAILVWLGLAPSHAHAQAAAPEAAATLIERPRVCLVLSGGGARGAAHVGVIRVLEELRVPIDCVVGTSMGALVGGAYASGMTTDEMGTLLGQMSTSLLFIERPPRQDQLARRKQDDRSILFGLEVGINDERKLLFRKGIVSGLQLEAVLRRLAKVQGFRKFDDLPITFRAVATDLVTGNPVVFDEGELPNVLRASMSVPGAIAPVEIDGKLLVDGGLTNNLPVDVAHALGAEIIIAVNLGTPLMKREELSSIFGVTTQMINILTEQNVRASLAKLRPTDILIEPELGDFSAVDFDDLPKTIPIGEAAARKATARLMALRIGPEAFTALRTRQQRGSRPDTRAIDEIRFTPMSRVNPATLAEMLDTKPGQEFDQARLDADMRRLYGTGDFEHVNYRILEEAGRRVLTVDAVEKAWGPNYLRFGLALGSDFEGEAFFNLAASYRRTWVNALGGEWRTDAQMGRTTRLATEFYQPLEIGRRLFVAPHGEVERRVADIFDGQSRIARYDLRTARAGIDFGGELRSIGELRAGVVTGAIKTSLQIGPQSLAPPSGRIQQGALTLRGVVDQLDSANFPRAGYAGAFNVFSSQRWLGADDRYTKWEFEAISAYSRGPHSIAPGVKVGGALGNDALPRYDLFQWGGFLQQSGYPIGGLIGERLTFGRLIYTYKLLNQQLLEGLYAGASLEFGRVDRPLVPGSPAGLLKSTALFLGLDTPIGPLYVGYGLAADGNRSAYLFLGRP